MRYTSVEFRESVIAAVDHIPFGKVMGYGDVARQIGYPGRARQVGFVLSQLFETETPWWRVIRSDGSIALRGDLVRGPQQIRLLKAEGIPFRGQRVDMSKARFFGDID